VKVSICTSLCFEERTSALTHNNRNTVSVFKFQQMHATHTHLCIATVVLRIVFILLFAVLSDGRFHVVIDCCFHADTMMSEHDISLHVSEGF
jgi:hypothetical protein